MHSVLLAEGADRLSHCHHDAVPEQGVRVKAPKSANFQKSIVDNYEKAIIDLKSILIDYAGYDYNQPELANSCVAYESVQSFLCVAFDSVKSFLL